MSTANDEPLVLINLFSMTPEMADRFTASWESSIADSIDAPGFRGTRLHRAIDPDSPHQLINIARWDSEEHWHTAVAAAAWETSGSTPQDAPVRAQPALYRVVHVTPDPQAAGTQDAAVAARENQTG